MPVARPLLLVLAALGALVASGCGGYAATVRDMNRALAAGDIDRALTEVDRQLGVEPGEAPASLKGEALLLLLERAALSQAAGRYERSAADFELADEHLQVLTLTSDAAGDVGRFLFSDDSGVYVGSPLEKLMINTLNLLNYLALGRLEPARVEARRVRTTAEYLLDEEGEEQARLALASYLAGLTFEASGRADEALRFYADALESGDLPGLQEPIRALATRARYRTPALDAMLARPARADGTVASPETEGTVVVVASLGRVPHRRPERIPIGLALTLVADARRSHAITAEQRAQADMLAARGLLTWINMPSLQRTPRRLNQTRVQVASEEATVDLVSDLEEISIRWFEQIRPTLVGSALTRMITRALASMAAEQATRAAGGNSGWAALAALAVQGALLAADTPDTRSWNSLGARWFVARQAVPAGTHLVRVRMSGDGGQASAERTVTIAPGQWVVLPVVLPQ